MSLPWRIFAVCVSLLFFGLIVANGIYMLSIPRKWLQSDAWFVNRGSSRPENFKANSKLMELRIVGAIFSLAGTYGFIKITALLLTH